MKKRVSVFLNFVAYNLLFFSLYLNFIHKDVVFVPVKLQQMHSAIEVDFSEEAPASAMRELPTTRVTNEHAASRKGNEVVKSAMY